MPVLTKTPQTVFDTVFAFPPNKETLGGTAYLILEKSSENLSSDRPCANILIDCPAFNEVNRDFIGQQGGIDTVFITHRGGMANVREFQQAFGAQVLIQEQEAYLLPSIETKTFHRECTLSQTSRVLWTAGYSPGSACLYHSQHGGILFTGRHLLPDRNGDPRPLRRSKTFHWPRQLRNAQRMLTEFDSSTLSYICPGASTGFLRGEKKIDSAYQRLSTADWQALESAEATL